MGWFFIGVGRFLSGATSFFIGVGTAKKTPFWGKKEGLFRVKRGLF